MDQIEKLIIVEAGRLLKGFLVVVGAVAWASLVPPLMADEIFPSDGRAPQPADAEFLRAVCPAQVDGTSCGGCPKFTLARQNPGLSDFGPLTVDAVTRGHFLSPTSEDAVLSVTGCVPPPDIYGLRTTILLTRSSRGWKMLWYSLFVSTSQCHKLLRRDRREILVCMDEGNNHGEEWTALTTEDFARPSHSFQSFRQPFFVLRKNSAKGFPDPEDVGVPFFWGCVEKVEFGKNTASGPPPITVTANFVKGVWTAELIDETNRPNSLSPPLKRYRIEFIFDGQDYKPTPASAATAKIFAEQ
jgi:hypothetical protein